MKPTAPLTPSAPPRIVHKGPIFSVERREFADPEGPERPALVRDIVRHPGAVAVVPVLPDGRVVLIRNFRVSVEDWLVELCAGKLEPGEAPSAAAARELEEETGYAAGALEKLGEFYTSPGFADELMHVFEARELTETATRREPGERIEVSLHAPAEIDELIQRGAIRDGKTLAGLFLWMRRRGR